MKRPKSFLDLADISAYRWPKKGDRLLRASKDWDKGVDFSDHSMSRDAHIWSGYMRAGAALVEECEREAFDRHFLVYPILFNYRHGLEVAIKWVIDRYGRHADVRLSADDRNHNLWELWKLCKEVILKVGSDGDNESLRVIEKIVKEFHDLDKTSFAFRYSTNKQGMTIRLPDTPIDLQNVKDVMEAVDNFFTGVDGQLDYNSDAMDWEAGGY